MYMYARATQRITHTRTCALVMKTTLMAHLSLAPYKESVTIVQIQMPFHAVGRSFRPSGGSYAPDTDDALMIEAEKRYNKHLCEHRYS